ncbi:GMC family oxidoreductase [Gallaecimonas sp. GXIMD4217]|uniref:GMC family oxidoreductase n=1 Tax=Gallaecimonas sp. GXIMD4217 TaxID=3131927 RepID=UPI00311ACE4F
MTIPDPIAQGIANGWAVSPGHAHVGQVLDADVVVVGSGAGGAITAERLSRTGLKVLLLEEGPLRSSNDFNMDEGWSYAELYQDGAARQTRDGAIAILQGRAVGGSTLVNWTSSFRTPERTLAHWRAQGLALDGLERWFEVMEKDLNISPWRLPPNGNNARLALGCERLGIPTGVIARNVRGCWNLGYCGQGCPTNAKLSMLVTHIPRALDQGAALVYGARAWRIELEGGRVAGLACHDSDGRPFHVRCSTLVLSAGAIGSPALLLRSGLEDDAGHTGRGTFLHPVLMSFARFDEEIAPYHGAPQSIHSDHFQWQQDHIGYKLEAMPLQPMLAAALHRAHGERHKRLIGDLTHTSAMLALVRDGFSQDWPGGQVELDDDQQPVLDYPLHERHFAYFRGVLRQMLHIQIAAGAKAIWPLHQDAEPLPGAEALFQLEQLAMVPHKLAVSSAHVMGGCAMATDPAKGLCDGLGRHFQVPGLFVNDGSLFPSSVGANPQLSIYALAGRNAEALAERLTS